MCNVIIIIIIIIIINLCKNLCCRSHKNTNNILEINDRQIVPPKFKTKPTNVK